ncbi:glycoside hydrolase family 3 C-terminal domain-containing protein [Mucilaginibacter sp. L3T2-6]|uniref:glycoside hydrolase family 3 C-terminal domain-containing protein n=1 Tax=Mucilaginibacter sp. L3T2-6 TaxID=3062491 RepID=UPI0026763099|nr:glycoside hydrolase family 3 C-terminal domain-containing protein [Mucilaginibacter sp. L3T2-6]MDO3643822.1 glycoside hydrolase family 3 C-terminal domain-containing protein [Mucilaginibacter sp. L3T2-6]MDV6216273.1 glycoside hydrolase family 3 C-terminal domain-containing protein [Mucilaginibacter sp. L3T2-6]
MTTRILIYAWVGAFTLGTLYVNAQTKKHQPVDAKIDAVIKKLTLEEKIKMLHANSKFGSAGVERLGIPGLMTDDGPLGVREDVKENWSSANLTTDSATFFPNGSALAATWNPSLAYRYGHDIGEEARARKKYIILAPAFNICRTPLCGRTYEYFSEDPFLNSRLAVQSVKGIQSQNIAACIKHFAVNNQEFERGRVNAEVDERTLQEIYLPAFKAAVTEANAWTIMSAYNKLRGVYCAENAYLLNDLLKKQWGFKGIVISDWGGTHSTVAAANDGLDLEMGSFGAYDNYFFANPLLDSVKAGKVSLKTIDEKVHRILWVMYHTSMSENPSPGKINTPQHVTTAYDIAAESIVLLKNDKQLLPLNTSHIKSIAVIGDNATRTFHLGGFGAGVKVRYEVTALAGLKSRLNNKVKITYAQGYKGVYKPMRKNVPNEPDKQDTTLLNEAVTNAKSADLAIVFIGGNREYESEGHDRKDLSLPFHEQELVDAVTAANANTIVVFVGGAPYDLSKIKKNNHTIVWSWYNGQENGNALADVLVGKVNPSGRMPFTFPAELKDSPAHALNAYPGENLSVEYKEGLMVGYRWFDTKKIEPLYCFGYGLSYTNYQYQSITIAKKAYKAGENIAAVIKLKNTGKFAGKETIQLYVSKANSMVERPAKELKAFKKVMIRPGETANVALSVPVKDLAYFDTKTSGWVVEPGKYTLLAGGSSGDIKVTGNITVVN